MRLKYKLPSLKHKLQRCNKCIINVYRWHFCKTSLRKENS